MAKIVVAESQTPRPRFESLIQIERFGLRQSSQALKLRFESLKRSERFRF
jgi:hypothetical protein